jgi:hypothetical protein
VSYDGGCGDQTFFLRSTTMSDPTNWMASKANEGPHPLAPWAVADDEARATDFDAGRVGEFAVGDRVRTSDAYFRRFPRQDNPASRALRGTVTEVLADRGRLRVRWGAMADSFVETPWGVTRV